MIRRIVNSNLEKSFLVSCLLFVAVLVGCEYNIIVEEAPVEEPVYVEPAPRFVEIEPTLRSIEDSLFKTTCWSSRCHDNTWYAGKLNLGRDRSYSNMVNVPSLQDSTILRVYPGKPDSSYLIWKLEGHPNMKGRLMPVCASEELCLDRRVIEIVREWIEAGAPDN